MNRSSFTLHNRMNANSSPKAFSFALPFIGVAGMLLVGCANSQNENKPLPNEISSTSAAPQASPSNANHATPENAPAASAAPGAQQTGQSVFATPGEAAATLKDAANAHDRGVLVSLFGDAGNELIFSGDPVQESQGLAKFAAHLNESLRVDQVSPQKAILYIGSENWPFPIPLVKGSNGWFFDTAAGREELLNRRIGADELNAIAVCRAFVTAQKEYASKPRTPDNISQYAQHFMSSEGQHNGLYWPVGENEEVSPMGPLVAQAQAAGYLKDPNAKHQPYKGYYFHMLTAQGDAAPGGKMDFIVDGKMTKGFAMIAWPDKWGASGIMTFIVNQDGKVYQKNLGEKTSEEVKSITEYNPDKSWEEMKD